MVREELFNPNGRDLYVVFMPWHAGVVPFFHLCKRIARRGNAVASYWLPDDIISADADVARVFELTQDVISNRLRVLRDKHGYKKVHFSGMSLGNVALSLVANNFKDFDDITMVCSASSVAECLWNGTRTQDIQETFKENGVNLVKLKSIWNYVEPENYIRALAGKDVKIVVANKDTHIPTQYQREYIAAIKKTGTVNLKVKNTRLGHIGAIVWYCVFGR